jgi:hypothetical protein
MGPPPEHLRAAAYHLPQRLRIKRRLYVLRSSLGRDVAQSPNSCARRSAMRAVLALPRKAG